MSSSSTSEIGETMSQTTIDVLRAVRELLADPQRWTQHTEARDAQGRPVKALDENAVCWCMGGALAKVLGERVDSRVDKRFESLWSQVDHSVGPWQDRRAHDDVLCALDRAIEVEAGA